MQDLLAECRWPTLAEPYNQALHEAVAFVLERYEVLGVIAGGTIVRGNPGPSSDLDVYVIQARPQRQRVQRFFASVPAELFVNPVRAIEGYFAEEQREGRPLTAHMLATGFVVLDRDPVVEQLRQRARELLAQPPERDERKLTWLRYMAATLYEDALDVMAADPATGSMILGLAVHEMLRYYFWQAGHFLPRDKELLGRAGELDPVLAEWARAFYETGNVTRRVQAAEAIAGRTIGVTGFFEWESPSEDV